MSAHAAKPREYCGAVRLGTGYYAPMGSGQRDWELHLMLRRAVMVRRRKAEVLRELPPKRRRWLRLPIDAADAAVDTAVDAEGGVVRAAAEGAAEGAALRQGARARR